jgi:hypothetical protein
LTLLAAAILGAAVSGVGGILAYKLADNLKNPAMSIWEQWVASDTIGAIAVAPVIIGLVASIRAPPPRRELLEGGIALIAVAATTGTIIFMLPADWWEMTVAVVLLFPVVLWVAARCPPVFAAAAVFIVSLIVIVTTTFKLGNLGDAAPSMDEDILSAQITIVGTALCAFILSALFAERRQHEAVLQEALATGAVMAFEWDAATDMVRRSNNAAQVLTASMSALRVRLECSSNRSMSMSTHSSMNSATAVISCRRSSVCLARQASNSARNRAQSVASTARRSWRSRWRRARANSSSRRSASARHFSMDH